jgi:hypothetical protein
MRQAIITKYHGPTNARGSRIGVRSQAGRKYYPWDDALDVRENHAAAAFEYAHAMRWLLDGDTLVGGALPDGTGYAFVIVRGNGG